MTKYILGYVLRSLVSKFDKKIPKENVLNDESKFASHDPLCGLSLQKS